MRTGVSLRVFRGAIAVGAAALLFVVAAPPDRADALQLFFAGFEHKSSNGYDASAAVSIQGKHRRTAGNLNLIKVLRGKNGYVNADYRATRASASWRRLRIELGELGRVQMRFEPRKTKVRKELGIGCRYERARVLRGKFVGQADFDGERGYTGFDLTRVRGVVGKLEVRGCRGKRLSKALSSRKGRRFRPSMTSYFVHSGGPEGSVIRHFAASKLRLGRDPIETMFDAEMGRKSDDGLVRVRKLVAVETSPRRFAIAGPEVTLTPSLPFSGTADVTDGAMTGDLAVSFPGEEPIALTPAKADFVAARSIAGGKSRRRPARKTAIPTDPVALLDLVR